MAMRLHLLLVFAAVSIAADEEERKCWTNYHKAASRGDTVKMSQLLAKNKFKADIEDKCGSGVRPLMLAAHGGHLSVVRQLIDAGASADISHAGNGVTPLIAAAVVGDVEMVKLFLSKHAAVDRAEGRNWTALSFASQQGHEAVVKALLAAGADTSWLTGAGLSPWALATDAGQHAVAALLEGAGAPAAASTTLWFVGRLPLDSVADDYGVSDAHVYESKLLGPYQLASVTAGMDPQQFAIFQTLQQVGSGGTPLGEDGDTSVEATTSDLGGGPMPTYAKAGAIVEEEEEAEAAETVTQAEGGATKGASRREVTILKFDPQTGSMMWQVAGIVPPPSAVTSAGAAGDIHGDSEDGGGGSGGGGGTRGVVYLRGRPPATGENVLDPVSVLMWEMAVGVAVEGATERQTKWIPAPDLRAVRGSEGERLWREQAGQRDKSSSTGSRADSVSGAKEEL